MWRIPIQLELLTYKADIDVDVDFPANSITVPKIGCNNTTNDMFDNRHDCKSSVAFNKLKSTSIIIKIIYIKK